MHEHTHEVCKENERKTFIVIIFTLLAMIAEIIYGYITNSMALLADGYHMATHALALGLKYAAYVLARKFEHSDIFINGTEKIGTLAGYTSSLFLGITGIWIIIEAVQRFFNPLNIKFNEAILVAIIGLVVN
ncbi:cation transporter, partial [bacterium]|nr:cation transporter [bacterium]